MSNYTIRDTITFAIRDKLPNLWAEADDIADIVTAALKLSRQDLRLNDQLTSPRVTRWVTRWEIANDQQ